MLLAPFDIKFVPQKARKGQVIADFLVAHPCPNYDELPDDLPDDGVMVVETKPWLLYFDGAARNRGAGVGICVCYAIKRTCSLLILSTRDMFK